MSVRYAVVDLETTGPHFNQGDRIIQIGMTFIEDHRIVDQYETLVNPERNIPKEIVRLTGINQKMVEDAPTFKEVAKEVKQRLEGTIFVAHNINFDYSFLSRSLENIGEGRLTNLAVDTVELLFIFYPQAESYQLGRFAESHGIRLKHAHFADQDAYATAEILLKIQEKVQQLSETAFKDLEPFLPFLIHDTGKVVKTWREKVMVPELKITTIHSSLPEKKTVGKAFVLFNQQQEMIDRLKHAYKDKDLFFQADTGSGKTLAYSIAVLSREKRAKLLMVTSTNLLIDQFEQQTLPHLEHYFHRSFNVKQLKSREHFLPQRAFLMLLHLRQKELGQLSKEKALLFMALRVWLEETKTGDRRELNTRLQKDRFFEELWEIEDNQEKRNEEDFYYQQWKTLDEADIVLTNHAFYWQHLDEFNRLNHYQVVIDEAHQFVRHAKEQNTLKVEMKPLAKSLKELNHLFQELLDLLDLQKDKKILPPDLIFNFETALQNSFNAFDDHYEILNERFSKMNYYLKGQAKNQRLFLKSDQYKVWEGYFALENLLASLKVLTKVVKKLMILLTKTEDLSPRRQRSVKKRYDRLLKQTKVLKQFLLSETTPVEIQREGSQLQPDYNLYKFDEEILESDKWQDLPSPIIWVSASFNVWDDLESLKKYFGRSQATYESFELPKKTYDNLQVSVLNDTPGFSTLSEKQQVKRLVTLIEALYEKKEGRIQLLFTSTHLLEATNQELIKKELKDHVYAQINHRSVVKLARSFERDEKGILLGVLNFAQGIHFREDSAYTIIPRLPFPSPEDPYQLSLRTRAKENNQDYFLTYALPSMLIQLQQMIGRASRETKVVVMDRRMSDSSYASRILRILPNDVKLDFISMAEFLAH